MSSHHPVFHLQLRHARELADVAGDHNKPVCSSDRGDHQVSIADGTALCGQVGTDAGIAVSGDRVEIEHAEGGKKGVLVRAGSSRLVALGGSEPHFGQGDGGNRDG